MTNLTLWWIALAASAIVVLFVALLFGLLIAATRSIARRTADLRRAGEQIAVNTAPIRLLEQANEKLREIRASLENLEQATRRLDGTIAAARRES
jgi:hypothetical protein